MIWLKYLAIIVVFYIFALLQYSFLPHLAIWGGLPNLIFITFFILISFEQKGEYYSGLFTAILAGFFLDVAGFGYFGLSMLALVLVWAANRAAAHFLHEAKDIRRVIYFGFMFLLSLVAYVFLMWIFLTVLRIGYPMDWALAVSMVYSLALAVIGFYGYEKISARNSDKQLKLF